MTDEIKLRTPSHGRGKLIADPATHPRDEFGRLLPLKPKTDGERDQQRKIRAARQLKTMVPSVIRELYTIVKSGYKPDTRVKAAQILLEHALGKPVQAIVPSKGEGGTQMTWEEMLKQVRQAAENAKK